MVLGVWTEGRDNVCALSWVMATHSSTLPGSILTYSKGGDTKLRSVESRAAELVGLTPEYVEPLQVSKWVGVGPLCIRNAYQCLLSWPRIDLIPTLHLCATCNRWWATAASTSSTCTTIWELTTPTRAPSKL